MADIELVIKISEDSYKATCIGSMLPLDVENVVNAIKNGTPLEHESILDKIRAEIEQTFLDDGAMQEYTVKECLRIIDKYRTESEE